MLNQLSFRAIHKTFGCTFYHISADLQRDVSLRTFPSLNILHSPIVPKWTISLGKSSCVRLHFRTWFKEQNWQQGFCLGYKTVITTNRCVSHHRKFPADTRCACVTTYSDIHWHTVAASMFSQPSPIILTLFQDNAKASLLC